MFEKNFEEIDLNNKLKTAVTEQKEEEVQRLLALDNPPYVDHEINGVPLILYAAQHKNWKIVEELYNAEANLDVKIDYMNWYLIHECIKSAPDRVTKAVMEYSNMNVQTKDGKTPLMLAIQEDNKMVVEKIVDGQLSNLALTDKNGENAAHYASKNKQYDLLIKLIENGCPINKLNNDNQSPIDLIEDVSFRENLPKVLSTLNKMHLKKESSQQSENSVVKSEDLSQSVENVEKPKLSGLSKIKRR